MKKVGLVVGKFAPLHKGHEFLLQNAARVVDELVVLIYDAPDSTQVPISRRADWIRALYPKAVIIEGYNPPPRDGWSSARTREHEEFIKNLVLSYRVTHVFSGEEYGARLAHILGAEHVRVTKLDEGMTSISSTMIRRHPNAEWFVSEHVYRDMQEYKDVL